MAPLACLGFRRSRGWSTTSFQAHWFCSIRRLVRLWFTHSPTGWVRRQPVQKGPDGYTSLAFRRWFGVRGDAYHRSLLTQENKVEQVSRSMGRISGALVPGPVILSSLAALLASSASKSGRRISAVVVLAWVEGVVLRPSPCPSKRPPQRMWITPANSTSQYAWCWVVLKPGRQTRTDRARGVAGSNIPYFLSSCAVAS